MSAAMIEPGDVTTVDRIAGVAAASAGSVAGAVIAFMAARWLVTTVEGSWQEALAVVAGWLLISVAAGATAWAATAPFWRYAPITGFSVFILTGILVYPAFALHRLAGVQIGVLVVGGALIAGAVSHWLVVRLDWT